MKYSKKNDAAGMDTLEYSRCGYYRFKLTEADLKKHATFLREMMQSAIEAGSTY